MDCIPYINNLMIEITILKNIKNDSDDNIKEIEAKIKEKENLIIHCKNLLSQLINGSIEYRIYINLLNGMNINSAISKVANENYINDIKPSSERAIYKNYYQKLKKIMNNTVKVQ